MEVLTLVGELQAGFGVAEPETCLMTHVSPLHPIDFTIRKDHAEKTAPGAQGLADLIRTLSAAERQVTRALMYQAERTMRHQRHPALAGAFLHVPVDRLSEPFLRSQYSASKPLGCSFSALMWQQTHFRSHLATLGHGPTEMLLDDKIRAYTFADRLGLRRAEVYQERVSPDALCLRPGSVIKPENAAGARGVYIVHDATRQRRVADGHEFTSYDALRADLEAMVATARPGTRETATWMAEELVCNAEGMPANDLKFYSFYGDIPLALEVRRLGEVRYCWWDRSGARIQTGKYDDELFEGAPFDVALFEQVEALSRKIPAPFLRIDFLRAADGLCFSEFTPRPGAFHSFGCVWDRRLGHAFVKAQARLFHDIAQGKRFEDFEALVRGVT